MSAIVVCPLSRLDETVGATGATHVVSLLAEGAEMTRPAPIDATNHLDLRLNDITEIMEGYVAPQASHVRHLLDFVDGWDRRQPMVVHCLAGISRSTAAAFIALCHLDPGTAEAHLSSRLRAASPTATPNSRLVALADAILGRGGRMVAAVESIGRGDSAIEGTPFVLPLRP